MKKLKTNHVFQILSHNVECGIYEGEILLSLDIDSSTSLSENVEKQVLEVHFNEADKTYICSILYDIPKCDNDDFSSRYYTLNDSERNLLKKYIFEKDLPFIML